MSSLPLSKPERFQLAAVAPTVLYLAFQSIVQDRSFLPESFITTDYCNLLLRLLNKVSPELFIQNLLTLTLFIIHYNATIPMLSIVFL